MNKTNTEAINNQLNQIGATFVAPFIESEDIPMSVPLYDRSLAQTQFLEDAKILTKDIFTWAKNQSKRSQDLLVKDLMSAAKGILYYAWKGNTTRLSSEENYQKRTKEFDKSLACVKDFHKTLTVIYYAELNPVTDNQYQKWVGLSLSVHKQITNIKKSDKNRMETKT